jgi:UDP-N-acetylmuramate dehydrogenase
MQTQSLNFSKYSSFKIGNSYSVTLVDSFTTPDMIKGYYLIGSCNNTLIGDNPPPLMMLSKEFNYIQIEGNRLIIGAATPSGKISSFCRKHNIANFEFLSHLPGKLGGLIKMNAGLKEYEIFNHLLSIKTISTKKTKDEIAYGYRFTDIEEPILEATFELSYGYDREKVEIFKKMRSNQPSTPSAGSCFKNPSEDYAGRLIEAVGLKGLMQGNICFSEEHANFLVNKGKGKYSDALFLIQEAQERVYKKFGITLELEIKILDEEYLKNS